MASNVFPILSSSPPPLDDCPDDDDDDDDFGTFTSANIHFDSSFDSPVTGDKVKKVFETEDDSINDKNLKNGLNKFHSYTNSETPSPQEFEHNYFTENQSNQKDFNCSEGEECKLTSDFSSEHCEKHIAEEKLQADDRTATSHTSVPDVYQSLHSPIVHKDGDVSDSSDVSNCSIRHSFENSVDCTHSVDMGDENIGDQKLSSFSEINKIQDNKKSNKLNANCHINSIVYENINGEVLDCEESSVQKTLKSEQTSQNSDETQETFSNNVKSKSSIIKDDSNVPNELCNSSEEFDDFQQAGFSFNKFSDCESTSYINEDLAAGISREQSEQEELKVFEPNFSDCHSGDSFHNFSDGDDFEDFQSCVKPSSYDLVDSKNPPIPGDISECDISQCVQNCTSKQESDDFADFQEFGAVETSDDFADFEAVPFEKIQQSDSCEFADFEGAEFDPASEQTASSASCLSSAAQEKGIDKISAVVNAIFPFSDEPSDTAISENCVSEILEQSNKSRRLWEKLHEVEQTPGLRFQWSVSHSFQQLLRSVNVDYHSILRTSSVPIFASGLSLLEPVKGHSSSVHHEVEDRNQSPRDPIPPVEFDWTSSGLVNPLDSGQTTSILMDISFLSSAETDSTAISGDHSFENELLKPSPLLACSENSGKTQILEQLLSKNISSLPNSKATHRPSNLSKEAVRVLDQLPDLSFMQAKVLMFPISSKT